MFTASSLSQSALFLFFFDFVLYFQWGEGERKTMRWKRKRTWGSIYAAAAAAAGKIKSVPVCKSEYTSCSTQVDCCEMCCILANGEGVLLKPKHLLSDVTGPNETKRETSWVLAFTLLMQATAALYCDFIGGPHNWVLPTITIVIMLYLLFCGHHLTGGNTLAVQLTLEITTMLVFTTLFKLNNHICCWPTTYNTDIL